MAMDPNPLAMSPPPMSRPPGVIRVACVIASPVNVIRPVANLDGYRAWITSIIRSTGVRSVIARVSSVISFTAYRAEHGEN